MTRVPRMAPVLLAVLALGAVAPSANAQQQQAFASTTATSIAANSQADPYPATIDVAGMQGTITHVSVKLNGLTFAGSNLDVMLESPHGESVMVTSDVSMELSDATLPFDDSGVPEPSNPDGTGSTVYQPTNNNPVSDVDTFPAPAPSNPAATLSALNGQDANGTWKLWINDGPDTPGTLSGWSVTITTTGAPAVSVSPASVDLGTLTTPGSAPAPQQTVTLTNTGNGLLHFNQIPALSGDNPNDFNLSNNGCLGYIQPGASCTVDVGFYPIGPGTKNALLSFDDNAAGSPQVVPVKGVAVAPPPSGPQESGSPDITVQEARFELAAVGVPTYLDVTATDPKQAITGLLVDFGEALGAYGESGCVVGKNSGGTTTFHVPYEFLTPGQHTVKVTIFAGGCGVATAHQYVFTVNVAPATTSALRAHPSQTEQTLAGPAITSKCKNKNLAPSLAKSKAIIAALICVMNEQRKLYKLKPLKLSARLTKAALAHTRSMITGQFFAHQGPVEAPLVKRLKQVKYSGAAAENLAAGAGPMGSPLAIVNGWMHSVVHRANLLTRKYKTVGIGFLPQFPVPVSGQPLATYTADFGVKP